MADGGLVEWAGQLLLLVVVVCQTWLYGLTEAAGGYFGHSPAHSMGSLRTGTNLNGLMGIAGGGTLSLMELALLN